MPPSKPADPAQARLDRLVEVRRSPVHGLGVFARRDIGAGRVIGHYGGRRYQAGGSGESAAAQARHARAQARGLTYVFALSDGSLIDGAQGGNATRHINHSCAPNCVAWETLDEAGAPQIDIEALRHIPAGSELFIDYDLDPGQHDPAAYACRCGAPLCRGSMLGAP